MTMAHWRVASCVLSAALLCAARAQGPADRRAYSQLYPVAGDTYTYAGAVAGPDGGTSHAEWPVSEYADSPVSEYADSPAGLAELLPYPTHFLWAVAVAVKWCVANASLIVLGAVFMVGLCTLTPFCHISFSKFEQLEELPAGYYRALDSAARLLRTSLDKYTRPSQRRRRR